MSTPAEVLARHSAQRETQRRVNTFRATAAVLRNFDETVLSPGIQTLPVETYEGVSAFSYNPYLTPDLRPSDCTSTDWEPNANMIASVFAEATGLEVHWKSSDKMYFTMPGDLPARRQAAVPAQSGGPITPAQSEGAVSHTVVRFSVDPRSAANRATDAAAWMGGGLSTASGTR